MRAIKFRVWGKDGSLIGYNRFEEGRWQCQMLKSAGGSEEWSSGVLHGPIIEQYSGLNDRSDVEIYEGDVCAVEDHPSNDYVPHGIVEWNDEETQFEFRPTRIEYADDLSGWRVGEFGSKNIDVIGNIHENPELLEPEAKQ